MLSVHLCTSSTAFQLRMQCSFQRVPAMGLSCLFSFLILFLRWVDLINKLVLQIYAAHSERLTSLDCTAGTLRHSRVRVQLTVVCPHSLAGFDFHDHRPAVLMHQHLLRDLDERIVWHRNSTSGSSRIASSAYQKWPTKNFHSMSRFN
jgi:hypothetical protein